MSTQNQLGGTGNVELEKTVTVVGYTRYNPRDARAWASVFDGSKDYYEKRTRHNYKLVVGGDTHTIYGEDDYEKYKAMDLGDAEVVDETEEQYKHDPDYYAREWRNSLLPSVDEYKCVKLLGSNYYSTEADERVCGVYGGMKNVGLIKHPSKMDPEEPFEDEDADMLALVVQFQCENVDEDGLTWLNENVIEPYIDALSKERKISRVRWYNCEQRRVDKGACFIL